MDAQDEAFTAQLPSFSAHKKTSYQMPLKFLNLLRGSGEPHSRMIRRQVEKPNCGEWDWMISS